MTTAIFPCLGVALAMLGLYQALVSSQALRRVIALNIMGSGVFLLLVALAARQEPPDPVPQAMVLTGLVVSLSATALALALIRRLAAPPNARDEAP